MRADGEKYLDLYGGHAVAGTGHSHPHVVAAIREQADKLLVLFKPGLLGSARPSGRKARCNRARPAVESLLLQLRNGSERECNAHGPSGDRSRKSHHLLRRFPRAHRRRYQRDLSGNIASSADQMCRVMLQPSLVTWKVFTRLLTTVAAIMLEPIQSMAGVRMAAPEFYAGLRRPL